MLHRGLENVALLAEVPADVRDDIMRDAVIEEFERKASIWVDGDHDDAFAFVLEGCIKLVKSHSSGRETILLLAGPGDLLCSSTGFLDQSYCCRAVVASNQAAILRLMKYALLEASGSHPTIIGHLIRATACRTVSLCTRVEEVSSGRVEQRLIKLFTRLAEKVGVEHEGGGIWIPVVLSRQDLADMCATTIETAIRTMRKLGKAGLLQTHRDGFVVPDVDELRTRGDAS